MGAVLEQLSEDARDKKGGYNARGLALALGMKGIESEDQIIARFTQIAYLVYPELPREKSLRQRMALIGMNANQ
jgi:hypothetical protein